MLSIKWFLETESLSDYYREEASVELFLLFLLPVIKL